MDSKLTEEWKGDHAVKAGVAGCSAPRKCPKLRQEFRDFVLAESKKYY